MPSRATSTTADALATALTTPVSQGMLNGGFATFAPHLRSLDERIRLGVRIRHATPPALRAVVAALRHRQAAEPDQLHILTDARLGHGDSVLLVSYRGRQGALEVADGSPEADWQRALQTAGVHRAEQIYPDQVTDSDAADKLVDRFLHDLASFPEGR